jgi:hypothetical protein
LVIGVYLVFGAWNLVIDDQSTRTHKFMNQFKRCQSEKH